MRQSALPHTKMIEFHSEKRLNTGYPNWLAVFWRSPTPQAMHSSSFGLQ